MHAGTFTFRRRVFIWLALTATTALVWGWWPAEWVRWPSFGMPLDLALTWWAPALTLLVPVTMLWAAVASTDRRVVVGGVGVGLTLIALFWFLLWNANGMVQPLCGVWQGCVQHWFFR